MLGCLAATEVWGSPSEEVRIQLVLMGKALMRAKPEMAPIQTTGRQWNDAIANAALNDLFMAGQLVVRKVRDILENGIKHIADEAASLCQPGQMILTYSCSGTVRAALLAAYEKYGIEVAITESRPKNEGKALAEDLAGHGMRVTYGTDAAIHGMMRRCSAIWVGADAVMDNHFINKVGTFGVALGAKVLGKPLYVLCDPLKILPAGENIEIQEYPKEEVYDGAAPLNVVNPYFELIPRDLVTRLIDGS